MRGTILLMLLLTTATLQANDRGFYTGAGAGITDLTFDLDIPTAEHDVDDITLGGQLFGGFHINDMFSVEAGYVYLGENDSDNQLFLQDPLAGPPLNLEIESKGVYANGQYHLNVGDTTSIDFTLGWFWGKTTARNTICCGVFGSGTVIGTVDERDDGYMAGIGLTQKLSDSIDLRVNVVRFAPDFEDTIESPVRIGIDVVWNFWGL